MFNRSSPGVGTGKGRINLVTDRSAPKSYKDEHALRAQLNRDSGHFFPCQSTDSRKVNLDNADTSLSTVCCNEPFFYDG